MTNKLTALISEPITILSGLILLGFDLSEQDQLRFVLTFVWILSLLVCSTAFVRWHKYDQNKDQDIEAK